MAEIKDEALAELVAAGVRELIERGRREALEEVAASQRAEARADDRLAAGDRVDLYQLDKVTPSWLMREAARRLPVTIGSVVVRSVRSGVFGCVINGLTPKQYNELDAAVRRVLDGRRP